MCVCGISKPNQTKLNQSKPKTICFVCLFKPSIETKANQTFSKINSILSAWNKSKSKVAEKLARAAQLLYRPVLVSKAIMANKDYHIMQKSNYLKVRGQSVFNKWVKCNIWFSLVVHITNSCPNFLLIFLFFFLVEATLLIMYS